MDIISSLSTTIDLKNAQNTRMYVSQLFSNSGNVKFSIAKIPERADSSGFRVVSHVFFQKFFRRHCHTHLIMEKEVVLFMI